VLSAGSRRSSLSEFQAVGPATANVRCVADVHVDTGNTVTADEEITQLVTGNDASRHAVEAEVSDHSSMLEQDSIFPELSSSNDVIGQMLEDEVIITEDSMNNVEPSDTLIIVESDEDKDLAKIQSYVDTIAEVAAAAAVSVVSVFQKGTVSEPVMMTSMPVITVTDDSDKLPLVAISSNEYEEVTFTVDQSAEIADDSLSVEGKSAAHVVPILSVVDEEAVFPDVSSTDNDAEPMEMVRSKQPRQFAVVNERSRQMQF